MPHFYHIILPLKQSQLKNFTEPGSASTSGEGNRKKGRSDFQFKNNERETLKKMLLYYGYGRWDEIRDGSKDQSGSLTKKSNDELRVFSNLFIQNLFNFISFEKGDIKKYLLNMTVTQPNDPSPQIESSGWGDSVHGRAASLGKRLQILDRINILIQSYIDSRKKYLALPSEDQNPLISKAYNEWENLLNFLPFNHFYGQRPCFWWTHRHDVELLYLTFKHGYTNYVVMKKDPCNTYDRTMNIEGTFSDMPNSDMITRRMKKLFQLMSKAAEGKAGFTFENEKNFREETGLTVTEKNFIVQELTEFGIPEPIDTKSEWVNLKEKLVDRFKKRTDKKALSEFESKSNQFIERFVQRLRIYAHQVAIYNRQVPAPKLNLDSDQTKSNKRVKMSDKEEIKYDADSLKEVSFDPDGDGFYISDEEARTLHYRILIFQYIRRDLKDENFDDIHERIPSLNQSSIEGYVPESMDGELIKHGFETFTSGDITLTSEQVEERLRFICEEHKNAKKTDKPTAPV